MTGQSGERGDDLGSGFSSVGLVRVRDYWSGIELEGCDFHNQQAW